MHADLPMGRAYATMGLTSIGFTAGKEDDVKQIKFNKVLAGTTPGSIVFITLKYSSAGKSCLGHLKTLGETGEIFEVSWPSGLKVDSLIKAPAKARWNEILKEAGVTDCTLTVTLKQQWALWAGNLPNSILSRWEDGIKDISFEPPKSKKRPPKA